MCFSPSLLSLSVSLPPSLSSNLSKRKAQQYNAQLLLTASGKTSTSSGYSTGNEGAGRSEDEEEEEAVVVMEDSAALEEEGVTGVARGKCVERLGMVSEIADLATIISCIDARTEQPVCIPLPKPSALRMSTHTNTLFVSVRMRALL